MGDGSSKPLITFHYGDKSAELPQWSAFIIVPVLLALVVIWALKGLEVPLPWSGTVALPAAVAFQQQQASKHFGEKPAYEDVFVDTPQERVVVGLYASDGMVAVIREIPGVVRLTTWIGKPAPPPQTLQLGDLSLASPALADGRCLDPAEHARIYGAPTQHADPPDSNGWQRVWNDWPDTCSLYYLFNSTTGQYAVGADGNPLYVWTRCVH